MEALLFDVHGNLPALEAVLEDAEEATSFILGGDYALFGGWPLETVQRLQQLENALWIRGNGERWLTRPDTELMDRVALDAVATAREALGEPLVSELAALPATARRGPTLVCHGSPASDVRSFLPEPADDEAELLEGVTADRLIFGHTHLPFYREAHGRELMNPGSVGLPYDGDPRASYVRLHDDGSIEHRRVPYDHAASAAKVSAIPGWGETVARRIAAARP
jgi:diadenosine tetraphosphatase ApaH/serine/threonine PP2A family protein phosphatase